jgi:hypothetical protein
MKRPDYPEEQVKIRDFVRFYRQRDKFGKDLSVSCLWITIEYTLFTKVHVPELLE